MLFLGLIILISFISNTFNTSFIKTSIGFSNICSYSIATYRTLGFEDFVQIGDLKIYNFQIGDFRHIEYAEGCLAEIVEFGKNKFNDICYFKNLPQVAFEEVDGIRFIYLYDADLPKMLEINDTRFNLQVAVCENTVKVGYPCIVDSV